MDVYEFSATLWVWGSKTEQWTFVTVPEDIADEVEDRQVGPRRGFGAVKVRVTIGGTTWDTSMFPSKEQASFILPIKAAVRKAEAIDAGATPRIRLELIPAY